MSVYVVKCDPLSGCLEPVKVSGNESLTLGCVWNSNDVAATINDCDGCQLAQLNQTSVALGLGATALNNGTSLGLGASSTCTAIALGCGATATDNGIAIGTNLTACCDEVLIGDKVIITDNTVINGSDGGCSNVVAINATATASCQVVINGLVDVNTDGVSLGNGDIYAKVCCDCIDIKGCTAVLNVGTNSVAIGANATTAAACSTAIGYCASVNCCCGTAIGASASTDSGVSIGRNAHSDGSGTAIGRGAYTSTMGVSVGCFAGAYKCGEGATIIGDNAGGTCYSVAVGSLACSCDYGIAIGYSSYAYGACKSVAIGYGSAALSSNTIVIGNDIMGDNAGCEGDTLIGSCSNVFKFCGATGYTYGNGCLMTGRIIDCAELPATCCENILFVVP